jgi:restriction endonuclease S subunit
VNNAILERYAAYKDSGVEWLGYVPTHWKSGRIKDFVNTNTVTQVPTSLADCDLVEFIPMSNIDDVLGKIKKFNFVPLKEVSSGYTKFKNRDVIFAKITPCMENGNCAIVSNLSNNICFGSTEFMVFRTYRKLSEKYLHYYFHNDLFRRNAEPFMRGTAGQKRISSHFMATHFLALPSLPEQQAITAYLDTKTAQVDRQIDLLSQKAAQYGKLKQSLINETVTRGLDKSVAMKDSGGGVDW